MSDQMTDMLEHRALDRLADFEARWRSDSLPTRRNPTPMGYQPGLDGLRAISVIAVIFYHAGFGWMHGGFLGVEVFFVVSGYLITSLLLEETRAHRRRAPAAVLAAACPAAAAGVVRGAHRGRRVGRVVRHAPNSSPTCIATSCPASSTSPTGGRSSAALSTSATSRRCATCGAWRSRSSGT